MWLVLVKSELLNSGEFHTTTENAVNKNILSLGRFSFVVFMISAKCASQFGSQISLAIVLTTQQLGLFFDQVHLTPSMNAVQPANHAMQVHKAFDIKSSQAGCSYALRITLENCSIFTLSLTIVPFASFSLFNGTLMAVP